MPLDSDSSPTRIDDLSTLRATIARWRAANQKIAFVPTMGALHRGHLSLVRLAGTLADRVIVSIFVNPKQFAAHEDLGTYPRREAEDMALLADVGCDAVWTPSQELMYPPGHVTAITMEGALTAPLCGASRPHFFGGVATVVAKLFNQVRPDIAVFGEKDYQQLLVIRRLVADLDFGIDIVGGPIVREADGLAMSSRNAYLSEDQREIAGTLNLTLREAADRIADGAPVQRELDAARGGLLKTGFDSVDYLEVRAGDDLSPLGPGPLSADDAATARIFVAAYLGSTRLIDNLPVSL